MESIFNIKHIFKKTFFYLFGKKSSFYWLLLKYKIRSYNRRKPLILQNVFNKPKIKVVFFTINVGMWKSDRLFQLLLDSERFEPYIVSFLYSFDNEEYRKYVQNDMKSHFEKKHFPFIESYNFETEQWFDIKNFNPDIVFYAQPYNVGPKEFQVENLWVDTLFAYIPYCLIMETDVRFYNTLLLNICWKVFYPDVFHLKDAQKKMYNNGENIIISGFPLVDDFIDTSRNVKDIWKIKDIFFKRIIWAPHHSIMEGDALNYSNFLTIADKMLKLAEKYKDEVQFAFKPHPRLQDKLYHLEGRLLMY